jgi:hypothetical protein
MESRKTEHRLNRIRSRAKAIQRWQENRWIAALGSVCLVLTVVLGRIIRAELRGVTLIPQFEQEYWGTMLLKDAGGYVLVAVLAFTVGVTFAIVCIHLSRKHKYNELLENNHKK